MTLAFIDRRTIARFIDDTTAFTKSIHDQFHLLDSDSDGLLSRSDISFTSTLSLDQHDLDPKDIDDSIFDRFDEDRSGKVDRERFVAMMRELMMAAARGIGDAPVAVVVEEGSVLMKAYKIEVARIEEEMVVKGDDEGNATVNGGEKINGKLKKRRSSKILGLCACTGKYLGQ
ncbi:hypothetical protein Droror1_Dr00002017 [Drosera rotundifolia]